MRIKNWIPVFFIFIPLFSFSQISNKRCKWITYSNQEIALDTLSVLPSSVVISYPSDSSVSISYDINTGKASLQSSEAPDSVLVCYTVFPFNLSKRFFRRDRAIYDTNRFYQENYGFRGYPIASGTDLLTTPGLNKSGSLVRGISFGNNQNVFVNSALNLQLEGKLTDDIGITAVISDQNIPVQPEGNTQQLQEFDKVYIQLHSKKSLLTVGDLVMQSRPGYFLKYYRNVQGGQFEGKYVKDSSTHSVTTVGAAVSKGKFASTEVAPLEGVQGPYRLRGPNNERFIIVLSNSEKVYVDGKLLVRGFDYDYTIDYNQAEITFTTNVLITKFSIIRVDFEYSEKNYGRANINASHYQTLGKIDIYGNYYVQRDNPNNPLLFNLDQSQKEQLSLAGDDLSRAVISGIDSVGFQENRILYKKVDSAGIEYYVYSINPEEAIYDVAFTNVGLGAGAYEQLRSTTNGKVFQYVGEGNGSYLPLRIVPTPQKDQMFTLGGSYKLSEVHRIYTELAFSEHDQNLFSQIDEEDDQGKAIKVGYINDGTLLPFSSTVKVLGSFDFEYNEKSFGEIDRFRDINFERDWSADPSIRDFNRILNGSIGLKKDAYNNVLYRISRRIKGDEVNGFQHSYTGNKSFGKLLINSNGFWMTNDKPITNSDWKRFDVNTSWNGTKLIPGIIYAFDKNKITNEEGRIVASAMYFDEVKFYVKSNDTADFRFYSDYAFRTDQDTLNGGMTPSSNSQTLNSGFNTIIKKNHEINTQFTYRFLQYLPIRPIVLQNEENVLTRIDWNADILNRHVRSELTVTSGTGRELKREFFYQPVPQGTGSHVWNDFNADGIQDLTEFTEKVAGLPYNQQEFILVFIPTDEYIKAYTGTINYRIDITAPRDWRASKNRIKAFVSKFSSLSSWTINKKILNPDLFERFDPSPEEEGEADVLSAQRAMRANLFFNRTNPVYGMDVLYGISENKVLLTQGFETRINKDLTYSARANIRKFYNVKLATGYAVKSSLSDFLGLKNFMIESYKITPEFAWQPRTNLRFTATLNHTDKRNIFRGSNIEEARFYEVGVETRFSSVSQRTISGNLRYINIVADLKGTPVNSPVAYELLDALRQGNNFTWNISWQEKLVNGLQLSFIYEGRKSQDSKTIHTGRMQASAFF